MDCNEAESVHEPMHFNEEDVNLIHAVIETNNILPHDKVTIRNNTSIQIKEQVQEGCNEKKKKKRIVKENTKAIKPRKLKANEQKNEVENNATQMMQEISNQLNIIQHAVTQTITPANIGPSILELSKTVNMLLSDRCISNQQVHTEICEGILMDPISVLDRINVVLIAYRQYVNRQQPSLDKVDTPMKIVLENVWDIATKNAKDYASYTLNFMKQDAYILKDHLKYLLHNMQYNYSISNDSIVEIMQKCFEFLSTLLSCEFSSQNLDVQRVDCINHVIAQLKQDLTKCNTRTFQDISNEIEDLYAFMNPNKDEAEDTSH